MIVRQRWLLFMVCIWALLLTPSVQAQSASVRLDGRTLFLIENEEPSQARQRAQQIEQRLNRALETAFPLEPVVIEIRGEQRQLFLAGRLLLSLTPEDARDRQVSIDALALDWKQILDLALQQAAEKRISTWGRFRAEMEASIDKAFARFLESGLLLIPRVLAGILVILFFWLAATLVRTSLHWLFRHLISDLTIENLIQQIAYYSVWALGLLMATSTLGIDPQTLVTAMGLTGVALGFALKDILSNFVAGILILWLRPFEIGDQIVVGSTEGGVEHINLRATQIRTYDGRAVLVPNAEVFTSRITNNTESPIRRGSVEFPVSYQNPLEEILELILQATQNTPSVLAEPPVSIRVKALSKDDILLDVRFWTDSRRSDFVATGSDVRLAIIQAFKKGGIDLPEPSIRILRDSDP